MASNPRTAASKGRHLLSAPLCAIAFAACSFAAGLAVGQEASLTRPPTGPRTAVASNTGAGGRTGSVGLAKRLASARPQVAGPLPETVWIKLGFAFRVAREKIRTIPGCAGLFTSRGADGLELLRSVTFAKATRARDLPPCERTAFALIEVGGRRIRLCSRFNELSAPAAAVILIHETLHAAGMSEKPPDPNALTGGEINRLVKNRCGD